MHRVTFTLRAEDPVGFQLGADGDHLPALPEGDAAERSPHLTWWFTARDGFVEAHYLFDDDYVAAHPEALDRRHLALLHALLNFKLFDDGDLLVSPRQLRAPSDGPASTSPGAR
ncbi:MAG: hypothetical protein R3A48_28185 [Polyangiales bacterium]